MSLWDRPNGPFSGAANSAAQSALNAQANQNPTQPVSQAVISSSEVKILSPQNTAVALSIEIPPNTGNEQTVFDVVASGYVKTTASGTLAIGLYGDGLAAVTSANLLHKTASATTQNSTTAPWEFHARLIYDSVSGKLTGKAGGMINNVIDPDLALTNVLTGINNATNPVVTFSLSLTSSGADGTHTTTFVVNKFTCG